MIRSVLLTSLFLSALCVNAAEQTELNGDLTLFSVMAALNAADFDAPQSTSPPLRQPVADSIKAKKLQIVAELKMFIGTHRKPDRGADLAQYISFALTSGEPPDFNPRFHGLEIPPDVDALEGFQKLMQRFHRDAGIEALWEKSQNVLEQALARYQNSVSRSILEVNAYLRNPTSGYMGRRFIVYLDLLGPASQVHTRSYKDDYFIVVSAAAEPQAQDIRHAYLHYLLDPLSTKFFANLDKKRGVIDYAQVAPALDESYKRDFLLLSTECLLRAIESRMDKKPAVIQEALLQGFVLTPYFAEQLPVFEKSGSSMRLYFPEMVDGINLQKEEHRLEKVEFASTKTVRKSTVVAAPVADLPPTPAQKSLDDAEKLYAGRELAKSRAVYMRVLQETQDRTVHSRVYYGLARIAALERNPELAEQLFRRTLELAPDPHTKSWTEVYLGRLYENSSKPEDAVEHYRAALAVDGAPGGAKTAATQGLQKLSQKQN